VHAIEDVIIGGGLGGGNLDPTDGVGGSIGDLTLSVIRRDLGIKDAGAFIIGRGDLLTIMDRTIFVAPIFYYVMYSLQARLL
jgi:predicted CDP-diglyceride synthetase/phosphatidate cytidylyltransferase